MPRHSPHLQEVKPYQRVSYNLKEWCGRSNPQWNL